MGGFSTTVSDATTSVIPLPPADVVHHDGSYNPEKDALGDIPGLRYALDLFLSSHMVESEDFCREMDPTKYVSVHSIPGTLSKLLWRPQGTPLLQYRVWPDTMRQGTHVVRGRGNALSALPPRAPD